MDGFRLRRVPRIASYGLLSGIVLALATAPVLAAPNSLVITSGQSILADANATQGHPDRFQWFVTPPGGTEFEDTSTTGPQLDLQLDTPGEWRIRVVAHYLHTIDGVLYSAGDQVIVTVTSTDVIFISGFEFTTLNDWSSSAPP